MFNFFKKNDKVENKKQSIKIVFYSLPYSTSEIKPKDKDVKSWNKRIKKKSTSDITKNEDLILIDSEKLLKNIVNLFDGKVQTRNIIKQSDCINYFFSNITKESDKLLVNYIVKLFDELSYEVIRNSFILKKPDEILNFKLKAKFFTVDKNGYTLNSLDEKSIDLTSQYLISYLEFYD